MKQKQLNDELTIVGLVLIMLFIVYHLVVYTYKVDKLNDKVLEAQRVAIFLNNRLAKTEFELTDTRNALIDLRNQREEEDQITQILKDIATSWNSRSKNWSFSYMF